MILLFHFFSRIDAKKKWTYSGLGFMLFRCICDFKVGIFHWFLSVIDEMEGDLEQFSKVTIQNLSFTVIRWKWNIEQRWQRICVHVLLRSTCWFQHLSRDFSNFCYYPSFCGESYTVFVDDVWLSSSSFFFSYWMLDARLPVRVI